MKDFSNLHIVEAAVNELVIEFVDSIKTLDREIAIRRLQGIINSHSYSVNFAVVMSNYNALIGCKTSMDEK